ncbi:response regulator transcription factor [Terrimonas sp.]|uniref:response regulator transcription factor n=1 Tax=Terrimonas sp. TaxID=1914338 RepID=UPI001F0BAA1D|nr:response regulator transcription factor [Terrimonas sp.]
MTQSKITEYTIAVIVPDADFRETLKMLFDYSFEFEITGLFKKVNELVSSKTPNPDIVLTEITDIDEVAIIKKIFPSSPLVIITGDETGERIVQLFAAGAAHYIFKGSEPTVYLNTLKEVLEEKVKISDSVIKSLLAAKSSDNKPTPEALAILTLREKDILNLLAKGLPYKEIAHNLSISIDTVRRHCFNIYDKLQVSNRTEALNKYFGK